MQIIKLIQAIRGQDPDNGYFDFGRVIRAGVVDLAAIILLWGGVIYLVVSTVTYSNPK